VAACSDAPSRTGVLYQTLPHDAGGGRNSYGKQEPAVSHSLMGWPWHPAHSGGRKPSRAPRGRRDPGKSRVA
jgi:hypothetical protein